MLGRLRIRGKLALVVALPLLAMALLTLPGVTGAMERAERAEQIRDSMIVTNRLTSLVSELRQERLLSLGYLFEVTERSRLVAQHAEVTDRIADITQYARAGELPGDGLSAPVAAALEGARGLTELRGQVLGRQVSAEQVTADFGTAITALIDSLLLIDDVDLSTPAARQVAALDASLRLNETASQATSHLLTVAATDSAGAAAQYVAALRRVDDLIVRFSQYATEEQVAQLQLLATAYTTRDETGVNEVLGEDPYQVVAGRPVATMFPPLESLSQLGRFVETKVITDVLIQVEAQGRAELRTAYLVVSGAVLVVLVVVALTVLLARTVVRPLLGLTASANRVAHVAETELARIADEESESAEPIRIEPVHATGRDEIGDLGRAFDRVQDTAVRLVERQVTSRRNVALMFGYLGRRTHNLVGRQIALIDQLEQQEADAGRLADLYRLDHVSSRLRRNAGSLVALSGAVGADEHVAPLLLTDVVRLALGEIEDYGRVDVTVPATIALAPAVIGDLVLVLAELMENATTFSPPHTRVSVTAAPAGSGVEVTITDHGIGMSARRLAEENARLARRERLDLAPTEVLGLFVVGRLARRHGLQVTLSATSGGGVTAVIGIGQHLLAPPAPAAGSTAAAAPAPAPPSGGHPDGPPEPDQPDQNLVHVGAPGLEAALVNVDALSKASRALEAGRRWNAFEVPRVAPPPEPSTPGPSAPAPPGPAPNGPPAPGVPSPPPAPSRPSTPPAPAAPAVPGTPHLPAVGSAAAPAPPDAAAAQRSGLRRRVPGASLNPEPTAPPAPPAAPRPHQPTPNPDEARSLVEQLQDGVARALSEIGSPGDPEKEHDDR